MDNTSRRFSGRRFFVGFLVGLAVVVAINVADYAVNSVPADPVLRLPAAHKVGFPWTFRVEGRPYVERGSVVAPGFYRGAFAGDVAVAVGFGLVVGLRFGEWLGPRGRRVGGPSA